MVAGAPVPVCRPAGSSTTERLTMAVLMPVSVVMFNAEVLQRFEVTPSPTLVMDPASEGSA